MHIDAFIDKVSGYAVAGQEFFFLIDFERRRPIVVLLTEAAGQGIFYNLRGKTNATHLPGIERPVLKHAGVDKTRFQQQFEQVQTELRNGNSYLLNLTVKTPVQSNVGLPEIFAAANAPYKLLFRNQFVVFSPESFIQIKEDQISTFPMKGTINASIPGAAAILMNNKKEEWEHNTIVDLMRNDLSIIATNVSVDKYRYIERIKTVRGELLQTSSAIRGWLPADWRSTLGDLLMKLLPAGSISGAPKQKTTDIIRNTETGKRGYYTGIFGIFDGAGLDSAVAIRFIENDNGQLYYRSGAGITADSDANSEYEEILQKIYVPCL